MTNEETSMKISVRDILQHSSDLFFIFDMHDTLVYTSPQIKDILGYKSEEVVGKKWYELIKDKNTKEKVQQLTDDLFKPTDKEAKIKTELQLQHKNGEEKYLSLNLSSFEEKGKLIGVVGSARDITEQKKSEEALKENEKKFRLLASFAPVGIYLTDTKGDCTYANPTWLKMTGMTLNEALGTGWVKALHPDDKKTVFANWQKMIDSKGKWNCTYRFITPEGKVTEVYGLASSQHNTSGELTGYIGINLDITKEKEAEEKLRESEEKLLKVLDSSPFPVAIADLRNENISYWSKSAIKLFGHTPSTVNEWFEQAYPDKKYREEVIKRWKPFVKEAQKTKRVVNAGEYEVTCKDGTILACEIHVNIVEDNIIVTLNDVTERKKAEKTVQKEQEFTEKTINALPGVFYIISKENKFIKWNNKFTEVTGLSDEEMKLISPIDLFEGEDKKNIAKAIQEVFTKGDTLVEGSFITKKGNEVPYYFNGSKIDIDGETYLVGMGIDITEKRKAEEALIESEQKYRELFNNMLNGFAYHKILFNEKGEPSDYVFLEVNKAFEELTGLKGELAKGKRVTEVIPNIDKDSARWIPKYGEIALTGKAKRFENYSEQIKKWFSIIAFSPQKNHFATIFEDITEKKLAEEKVKSDRDKLLKIINSISQIIIAIDKEGNITEWNNTIAEKSGIKEKDIIGKNISEKEFQGPLLVLFNELAQALESGKTNMKEFDIEDDEGNPYTIVSNTSLLRNANYEIDGVILVGRDVSYRRKIYQQIEQGKTYITDRSLEETTKIFTQLAEKYATALCICRSSGSNNCICAGTPQEKTTKNKIEGILLEEKGNGKNIIAVEDILSTIQEKTKEKSIILLSRLDYIVHQIGFSATLRLLYTVHDYIKNTETTIIIHLAKECFNEQELALLKQEFNLFQIVEEEQINEKLLKVLHYIKNTNENHISVNFNSIAKEFDITRVTVRHWINELQEKRLVNIQKEGKEKNIILTNEAKQLL